MPGPLVGPVLGAQMGYLPGTIWIIIGAVFAGCVQDFLVLSISVILFAPDGTFQVLDLGDDD